MKTKVTIWETKITFIDIDTKEVTTVKEVGRLTVKQAKLYIPENSVLVTKISEKETFEVDTHELLKLREEN